MGIQDRDYYRDGSHGLLDVWGRQGVIVWLIVTTSVVFFAQCLSGGPGPGSELRPGSELTRMGLFSAKDIMAGEVWRLITPLFLHINLWHLFANMLILYWAGIRIEETYGSRETLAFYLLGGAAIHAVYLVVQIGGLIPPNPALGASGAVTAILVLFALHFPHEQVYLFFILRMPVWLLAVLYIVLDVFGLFGFGNPRTAFVQHLAGAAFGLLYYQTGFRFTSLFPRWDRARARHSRPQLRLVPVDPDEVETVGAAVENPPGPKDSVDEHFEARLDHILEKVSRNGQESLTAEEREVLVKASELYKKRRR